jgi:hypothetical protein
MAKRDYKAEYLRRIKHGLKKGLNRSQARGHARALGGKGKPVVYDRAIEDALRFFRESRNLAKSARQHHISAERLRRYARQNRAVRKVGRKWTFLKDSRGREVPLYTLGEFKVVTVKGFAAASKGFKYMLDVDRFTTTNDIRYLSKWRGEGIEDIDGRWVPFETRPNVLYRLNAIDKEPFEQIYRIVI